MNAKVIEGTNATNVQHALNEFLSKNPQIQIVSATQSQSDSTKGVRIYITIIYK